MKRLVPYTLVGCLVLACGAEVPEDPAARAAPTRIGSELQPDQVVRLPPEKVFQRTQKGELLLVCAYETDVAFRAAKLKGAISFAEFSRILPTLDLKQEIVFYCA